MIILMTKVTTEMYIITLLIIIYKCLWFISTGFIRLDARSFTVEDKDSAYVINKCLIVMNRLCVHVIHWKSDFTRLHDRSFAVEEKDSMQTKFEFLLKYINESFVRSCSFDNGWTDMFKSWIMPPTTLNTRWNHAKPLQIHNPQNLFTIAYIPKDWNYKLLQN